MMGRYILLAILFEGVFGDAAEVKSVMEGDLVTLNTDVTKKQEDMVLWYFEDTRIALINGHPSTSCFYDGVGGRFRDRLEVDYETGSLTITNIRSEHAGRYEAELDKADSSSTSTMLTRDRKCNKTKIITKKINFGETVKTISLTVSASKDDKGVFGDAEEVKSVMEGDSVALNTDVTKGPSDTMLWYFEDTRIALINGHPSTSCFYDGVGGRFRDRLEVDYETGSLTITNIRSEHAGRYEAELDKADSSSTSTMLTKNRKCDSTKIITKKINFGETVKTISLTVSVVPGSGLSPAAVAGIVVGVLLAAAAVGGVVISRRSIFRNDMKKKKQIPEQVSNDETQNDKSLLA